MKYTVSMKVEGRVDVEVEAKNPKEAKLKAYQAFGGADLSKMDFTEVDPVNCTDEDGNLTDY